MSVVRATVADAKMLAVLHKQCFDDAWDAAAITTLMAGPGVFALVIPWDAFMLARVAAAESEILTLATRPAARRRGHGRALVMAAAVEGAARGAHEMFLEVAADNEAAVALYSQLGFERAGGRPGYYVGPDGTQDALILRAPLPLPSGVRVGS